MDIDTIRRWAEAARLEHRPEARRLWTERALHKAAAALESVLALRPASAATEGDARDARASAPRPEATEADRATGEVDRPDEAPPSMPVDQDGYLRVPRVRRSA